MLALKNINIFYGKLHILWDLSLEVGKESVGLFGPNGAGKTTLINAVLGLVRPVSGEIQFDGGSLLSLETYQRIRRGISVVPQERELFPEMTVMENLRAGAAYIPGAKGKGPGEPRFCLRDLPRAQGTGETAGRDVERRRTADAGHRPGPHGRPEDADLR